MIKNVRKQIVDEVDYGMLVWQCADGEFLADDDNNFMHVFLWNTDPALYAAAEKALKDAATFFGYPEGKAVFWRGKRPVTDEELAHQLERAEQGLTPDPFDLAAIREEERDLKRRG